jgi:hypothetical protein
MEQAVAAINQLQQQVVEQQTALQVLQAQLAQAQQPHQLKLKPTPPPTFDGSRTRPVDEWLFTVEQYFHAAGAVEDQQRITFAGQQLRDNAARWWMSVLQSQRPATWEEFKAALLRQYQPINPALAARQELKRCSQRGSVADYVSRLRAIFLRIPSITDEEKLERFKDGLKREILFKLIEREPASFEDAVRYSEHYDVLTYTFRQQQRAAEPRPAAYGDPTPMELGAVPEHARSTDSRPRLPRLTAAEKQRCMDEQLCFYCLQPGHSIARCPLKQGNGQ